MTVNKKVDEKELKNVAGGFMPSDGSTQKCDSCGYENDTVLFNPTATNDGCTHYKTYTCPRCGHSWTIEL